MGFIKNVYLTKLFFLYGIAVVLLYTVSYSIPWFFVVANACGLFLVGLTCLEAWFLFSKKEPFEVERTCSKRMNLGDQNKVVLRVVQTSSSVNSFRLIEGFPEEMQERILDFKGKAKPGEEKIFTYFFQPRSRGDHRFGDCWLYATSFFGLTERRIIFSTQEEVQVYPSIEQMKQYELMVFHQQKVSTGVKRIRRIGNASEFEKIKTYVQGDEIKRINWKATSRKNELMVNQYQDERSQPVFCLIDKSKSMQIQFEGMSLLDYAINSTLVLSNIILKKGDKVGMLTFANKIGTQLPADRSANQMRRILQELYNQQSKYLEANYELMYEQVRGMARHRSLLMLFTNFETEFAMRRALPTLMRLNKKHILIVVFFENTELEDIAVAHADTVKGMYRSIVAERMTTIKSRIAAELNNHGIKTILTHPSKLSVDTINKYLEVKSRGLL